MADPFDSTRRSDKIFATLPEVMNLTNDTFATDWFRNSGRLKKETHESDFAQEQSG